MAEEEHEGEVRGTVEGTCPECDETIPKNHITCPGCGYKRKFNQEQYDLLRSCSHNDDIQPWNESRDEDRSARVELEAANLQGARLAEANLGDAVLRAAALQPAKLQNADLRWAHLESAHLEFADLSNAILTGALLQDVRSKGAYLTGCCLLSADLRGADLLGAHLEETYLRRGHLGGAELMGAHLESADALLASVDGETIFADCFINDDTDFTGVGLAAARIQPTVKAHLEYNIRKKGWLKWYEQHGWWWTWVVKLFWAVSDYGRSTRRIVLSLGIVSLFFAAVYYFAGLLWPPGFVEGLYTVGPDRVAVPELLIPVRSLYFSIVTTTTLGFGDIAAHPGSFWGHVLLSLQVFLGYIILGALITRFAIMFQGPAVPWERSDSRGEVVGIGN